MPGNDATAKPNHKMKAANEINALTSLVSALLARPYGLRRNAALCKARDRLAGAYRIESLRGNFVTVAHRNNNGTLSAA